MASSQKGNRLCNDFRVSRISESADKSVKDLRTDSRPDNQLHREDARERVFVRTHRQHVAGAGMVHELHRKSDSTRPTEETKDLNQEHLERGRDNSDDRCGQEHQRKIDSIFACIFRYQEQGALQLARERCKPWRQYGPRYSRQGNERPFDKYQRRLLSDLDRLCEPISEERRRLDVYNVKREPQVQPKRFKETSPRTCQKSENRKESLSALTTSQPSHKSIEAWGKPLHDQGTIRACISRNHSHLSQNFPAEYQESISNVRTKLFINNSKTYESKSIYIRQSDDDKNRQRSPYLRHCGGRYRGVSVPRGARHLQSGLSRLDCLGSPYIY